MTGGLHPQITTEGTIREWCKTTARIIEMGPPGEDVLKQISFALRTNGGVSSLEVGLYISAYLTPTEAQASEISDLR